MVSENRNGTEINDSASFYTAQESLMASKKKLEKDADQPQLVIDQSARSLSKNVQRAQKSNFSLIEQASANDIRTADDGKSGGRSASNHSRPGVAQQAQANSNQTPTDSQLYLDAKDASDMTDNRSKGNRVANLQPNDISIDLMSIGGGQA